MATKPEKKDDDVPEEEVLEETGAETTEEAPTPEEADAAENAGATEEVKVETPEPAEAVTFESQLKEIGVSDDAIKTLIDQELDTPEALSTFTYQQFVDMGVKAGSAKKLVEKFFNQSPTAETASSATSYMSVLPEVPEDVSFTESLKVGGILKPTEADVMAAVRSAIAAKVHLDELPEIIVARMEEFAEQQDNPVGESFYRLQKQVTSKSYGELFSALGISGNYASAAKKNAMLLKLDNRLWPAAYSFHNRLCRWVDTWNQGTMNPMALMAAFQGVGRGGALPPGIGEPPETASLRDAAEDVINELNKIFSGTGIPIVRAMAWDAMRITNVLSDPALPPAIGATNEEQMLKLLGVAVSADYVRLERNMTRYMLALLNISKQSDGDPILYYLSAMYRLGNDIAWDKLYEKAVSTHDSPTEDEPRAY